MTTNPTHITNGMIEQASIMSSQALFKVQEATANNIMTGSKDQQQMGKLLMQMAETALNEAMQNLQKLQSDEEKAKHASLWEKIFGGILTAIMCVVAAVTGQPELAVISIALYVGSISGATKWGEEKIADLLHSAFGLSKSVGMVIASVLIIVASVAVGGGARALAGKVASLAGKGAEAGVAASAQVAEEAAAEAAEESGEEAGTTVSTSLKARLTSLLSKIPAPLARAITAGAMTAGSVNLGGNLAEIAHDKKLAEALEGIVAILSLIAGLIGGGALSMEGLSNTALLGTKVLKGAMYAGTLSSLGQGAAGTATGYFEYEQGVSSQGLTEANAVSELFNGLREMNTEQWGSLIKQMGDLLKTEGTDSGRVAEGMASVNSYVAQLMA